MVQQLLTQQYISETRVVACFPPLKGLVVSGLLPLAFSWRTNKNAPLQGSR
jgi:hypothetical protein